MREYALRIAGVKSEQVEMSLKVPLCADRGLPQQQHL